ncbi:MAG: hypothetical protein LQ345_005850, partial [Seirophora villosa]
MAHNRPGRGDLQSQEQARPLHSNMGKVRAKNVGEVLDPHGLGSEVETQDKQKTTLSKLIDDSKNGVVLFSKWKASTRG